MTVRMTELATPKLPLSRRVAAGLIRAYQLVLSPWVTQQCRYYPSCSAYALEAVQVHGVFRGVAMAAWRLLRCNPFSPGGVDYVPGSADAVSYAARAAQHDDEPVSEPGSAEPARATADLPATKASRT
jgi:putative membrane protein insertion efficiency factor